MRKWSDFEAEYFEAVRRYGSGQGSDSTGEVVDDPLRYKGDPLRYTPSPRSSEPLRSLLEYTAHLAQRYGQAVGEAGLRPELTGQAEETLSPSPESPPTPQPLLVT